MKKTFETPVVSVVLFSRVDVITASDNDAIWNSDWDDKYGVYI